MLALARYLFAWCRQWRVTVGLVGTLALVSTAVWCDPVAAAPGDLDPSFGVGGKVTTNLNGSPGPQNDQASALVIQPDGKMVVGGRHGTLVQGQGFVDLDFALVRYNADGTLDSSFGSGGKATTDFNGHTLDEVSALVLQPDGKIVAAGDCAPQAVAGVTHFCGDMGTPFPETTFALARYNTDGSLDSSFGTGGKATVAFRPADAAQAHALALQSNGKIVVAGQSIFSFSGSIPTMFALARYNTDGTLDGTFGTSGRITTRLGTGIFGDQALAVAVQADGKIIAAGHADFTAPSGATVGNFALARYLVNGTLDSTFGTGGLVIGGDGIGRALALQPDGKILLAGVSGSFFALERYKSDGSLDPSFGGTGRVTTSLRGQSQEVFAIVLQPDAKILVAGYAQEATRNFALARYNSDGTLDTTFDNGGEVTTDFGADEIASAVTLQTDGKIVAAGSSCVPDCVSGTGVFALARYQGGTLTTRRVEQDFNGDGRSDILWRHSSGVVYEWQLNGTTVIGTGSPGGAGTDWTIAGVGDFNGDGKADILWRHTSGAVYIWLMDGTTVIGAASVGSAGTEWSIVDVGDFNGDGKADILWRSSSGVVFVWLMDGTNIIGTGSPGSLSLDWQIAGVGDFNGDGQADILWRHSSGMVSIWLLNGTSVIGMGSPRSVATDWTIEGVGDFNGDGKADILWRHTSGVVYVWLMDGTSIISAGAPGSAGIDWSIQTVADFNGDGNADILWRHSSGALYIWFVNGTTIVGTGSPGSADPSWAVQ
ncbi:MAG TPA: FG-GAP-like repeat-containing protein [Candidatus Methylomirabilis sp.]|nr:FG-GAP-like repeat-containing protein [Candidatus Methylomirabilis sp.]